MRATAHTALALAALAAVTVTGCTTSHHGVSSRTGTPTRVTSAPAAAAQTPSPAQATALAGDLSSGDPARVAAAIGTPPGQAIDPNLTSQLASAGPIVFSPTITPVAPGIATTTATVGSGANQQTWDVRLALVNGAWVVGTTTLRGKP